MRGGRRSVAALLGVGLVAILAFAACSPGPDKRYAADTVRPADVVERVDAPGTVQPSAQADLKAPTSARIDQLVADGAKVKAADVVAQLSSGQVDAALRQAQAAVQSASSLGAVIPTLPTGQALGTLNLIQAQVTTTSSTVLAALRAMLTALPAAQRNQVAGLLDSAQAQLAQAQVQADQTAKSAAAAVSGQTEALRQSLDAATAAQRSQAQLALALAQQQKDALTLRAPISGTVQLGRSGAGTGLPAAAAAGTLGSLPEGAQQALGALAGAGGGQGSGPPLRVGSDVVAGQTVASVFDVAALTVAAEVDETDVALVRAGERALVELDAFPGVQFAATVRRVAIAPSANRSASGGVTYEADLTLGRATGAGDGTASPVPRVGMTATAAIEVRRAVDALSVPSSALVGRVGGQAVYVISGGHVHLRPVRVAAEGEDRVAIASGVGAGERVVVKGAERLRDGQGYPGA